MNNSSIKHLVVHPILLTALKMTELHKTPEVINMEYYQDILVIVSFTLYLETIYILQIIRDTPIGQSVTHQTMIIEAFIIVYIKYDSSKTYIVHLRSQMQPSNVPYHVMSTGIADGVTFILLRCIGWQFSTHYTY